MSRDPKPPQSDPSKSDLFKSQTITVSAETQRQWSLAKLPRTKDEDLLETYPPNKPNPGSPGKAPHESQAKPHAEVKAEAEAKVEVEPTTETETEPEHQHTKTPEPAAPEPRDADTLLTRRIQKKRAQRRMLLAAALAALLLLALIAIVTRGPSGGDATSPRHATPVDVQAVKAAPTSDEAPEATPQPAATLSPRAAASSAAGVASPRPTSGNLADTTPISKPKPAAAPPTKTTQPPTPRLPVVRATPGVSNQAPKGSTDAGHASSPAKPESKGEEPLINLKP